MSLSSIMLTSIFVPAALATSLAVGAVLVFYPVRGPGGRVRTLVWLVGSVVVALCPSLIPTSSNPLRFVATLFAITLLVKLYDLFQEPRLAGRLGFWPYLAYLPNGFWLVLRREPSQVPRARDVRRLAGMFLASCISLVLGVGLWRQEWSAVPFAFEHALKASTVVLAVALIGNGLAAAYRLVGGQALDPMGNLVAARTPADFWRRWNRPAQHFLSEYAFLPTGGLRRAARAIPVTFGASGLVHEYVFGIATGQFQGCQILFFAIQGCAVLATMRLRTPVRFVWLGIAGTLAFNLSTSLLFFRSVDAVLPFYAHRNR
jgi:hypothetical protein